ncbi:hypothetical protein K503DRAFT_36666 [Rhizopogon vinicolor AM-OR11-026]|uniref:Uncharacterized protein n=1 Tax=Rhizopogon vinicolor AM-OR11-026 TaxID=1314800 RepID=A0A1B7N535_9AGAM|nr:hypothetical protein K503DRAFT_36666 [Rhizopogon vinicolor AM-OR11-026]
MPVLVNLRLAMASLCVLRRWRAHCPHESHALTRTHDSPAGGTQVYTWAGGRPHRQLTCYWTPTAPTSHRLLPGCSRMSYSKRRCLEPVSLAVPFPMSMIVVGLVLLTFHIGGHCIWRVKSRGILPYSQAASHSDIPRGPDKQHYDTRVETVGVTFHCFKLSQVPAGQLAPSPNSVLSQHSSLLTNMP